MGYVSGVVEAGLGFGEVDDVYKMFQVTRSCKEAFPIMYSSRNIYDIIWLFEFPLSQWECDPHWKQQYNHLRAYYDLIPNVLFVLDSP